MGSKNFDPHFGNSASPGKIFIGGLAKDATLDQFTKYFGKYGEITDSVIMKDRLTGRPRGFGFVTYDDPSVVDTVIAETHIINGKQVEIKRTIPKDSSEIKELKTKKIFVGGIPTSFTDEEFKNFFSKFGKVVEHVIIRDHETKRSRGFGFIVFDNEQVVDNILANGNKIDMSGTQVEIKKAEPKKSSDSAPAPAHGRDSRGRGYVDDFGGFGNSYSSFGSGNFEPPYRTFGDIGGGRIGDYGRYGGGSEFGERYGGFGGSDYMSYRGDPSLGYSSRFGSYEGGFGGGYGGSGLGGYGRGGGGYGNYSGAASGVGYDSGPGAGYGGAGGLYGSRAGYNGGTRYHPYAR